MNKKERIAAIEKDYAHADAVEEYANALRAKVDSDHDLKLARADAEKNGVSGEALLGDAAYREVLEVNNEVTQSVRVARRKAEGLTPPPPTPRQIKGKRHE